MPRSSFSQYQLSPTAQPHAHSVSPAPSNLTIRFCLFKLWIWSWKLSSASVVRRPPCPELGLKGPARAAWSPRSRQSSSRPPDLPRDLSPQPCSNTKIKARLKSISWSPSSRILTLYFKINAKGGLGRVKVKVWVAINQSEKENLWSSRTETESTLSWFALECDLKASHISSTQSKKSPLHYIALCRPPNGKTLWEIGRWESESEVYCIFE